MPTFDGRWVSALIRGESLDKPAPAIVKRDDTNEGSNPRLDELRRMLAIGNEMQDKLYARAMEDHLAAQRANLREIYAKVHSNGGVTEVEPSSSLPQNPRIVTLIEHTSLVELKRIMRTAKSAFIRGTADSWATEWKVKGTKGSLRTNDEPNADFCGWVYSPAGYYEWWENGKGERRRFDNYVSHDGGPCRCPGDLHPSVWAGTFSGDSRSFFVPGLSEKLRDNTTCARWPSDYIHANPRFLPPPSTPPPGAQLTVLGDDEVLAVLARVTATAESWSHAYERVRREGLCLATPSQPRTPSDVSPRFLGDDAMTRPPQPLDADEAILRLVETGCAVGGDVAYLYRRLCRAGLCLVREAVP